MNLVHLKYYSFSIWNGLIEVPVLQVRRGIHQIVWLLLERLWNVVHSCRRQVALARVFKLAHASKIIRKKTLNDVASRAYIVDHGVSVTRSQEVIRVDILICHQWRRAPAKDVRVVQIFVVVHHWCLDSHDRRKVIFYRGEKRLLELLLCRALTYRVELH